MLAATAALAVVTGLVTLVPTAEKAEAATAGLVTAWPADVNTLDPGNVSTDQDKELTMNIYQRLIEYKFAKTKDGSYVWKGLDSNPSLARSYTLSGSTAVFHLRTDVKFSPSGNPLTAQDVVWSFARSLALGGKSDLNNGGIFQASQVVATDDHTVTFTFTDVNGNPVPATPTLLATMRFPNMGIVDSVTAEKHATAADPLAAKWLATHVAGTGPYDLASRTPGQQLQLKAVPKLWSGQPAYRTVTIRVVNNGNIASLVRGGSVNEALFGLTQNDLNSLKKSGFTVDHQTTPDFVHLQLPESDPSSPFANQDVRQAVAYAVPYSQIVDSVYFGRAQRALSYVNLKAPGYSRAWGTYKTSISKAKALMAKAGNPQVSVPLQYSNAEPAYEDMALLIKNALKKIGIAVTLKPQTPGSMFSQIITRGTAKSEAAADDPKPTMMLFNLSIYLDDPKSPVSFYSHSGGALNYPRFSDAEFDATADKYQFAPVSAARNAAYRSLQKQAAADASFIPLVITGRTVVLAKNVTGASYSPEIGVRFWMLKPKK